MNVLALNSGPRPDDESYTYLMLSALTEGMRKKGADVEMVNLREKTIRHCIGCFSCWTKTPGQCIHKDDMSAELFPKLLACDLVIYASPLYYHTLNALMASFIERTLPAAQPFFEQDEQGITYHPMRFKVPDAVLLSVCGFPELSEFDAMLTFFEQSGHPAGRPLASICRPAASLLSVDMVAGKAKDVLDATRQAGEELIENGCVLPDTMARITQPLGDATTFGKMGNIYWKTCIAEGVTPREFDKRKMSPRPQSLEDFMFFFPYGLNARAAGDRSVYLQMQFSGLVDDACFFAIQNGRVEATQGVCEKADITIHAPFDVWMDVITGKADGQQAFLEQKYKVDGDLLLMTQLFQR